MTNQGLFSTNKVKEYFPEVIESADIAGIIYHSLGNNDHIIWYRPETRSEINWGGDPEKVL